MNGTVGDLCQSLIMRHNYKCLAQTVTQIKEQLVQLFLIMRIQTSGRLIRQHHRRMIDERTGNGNPLLLATGQLMGLCEARSANPMKSNISAAAALASCCPIPAMKAGIITFSKAVNSGNN